MKKPAPTPENHVIFAAIIWVAVSFLGMALSDSGIYGSKSIAEALALAFMIYLFPNEPSRRWSLGVVGACIAIAGIFLTVWLLAYGLPGASGFKFQGFKDFRAIDVISGFVATGIIAPLFEEKLARHLALRGIAGMVSPAVSRRIPAGLVGTLIVSAIFAVAHPTLMPIAFVLSIVLCYLALKHEFSFMQRALLHGLLNCSIMTWYLTYGFGLQS